MVSSLHIGSYNILADSYIRPSWYPRTSADVLRWETRSFALIQRFESLNADVLCLQEVEEAAYVQFEQHLARIGYRGNYARKGRDKPDGCATFIRQECLRLVGSEHFYYHDGRDGLPDSGHVALVTCLEWMLRRINVVNTHLKWETATAAPEAHIGYRQLKELLDHRVRTDSPDSIWILCGDLNAQSDSPIVKQLIDNGFADACAGYEQFTCNPNGRAKRIDYLFHTRNLRATPARLMDIDDFTALPSITEPSDHLAVVAKFTSCD